MTSPEEYEKVWKPIMGRDRDYWLKDPMDYRIDKLARAMMAEWERVERKPVHVTQVASFADMARVAVQTVGTLLADELEEKARYIDKFADSATIEGGKLYYMEFADGLRYASRQVRGEST